MKVPIVSGDSRGTWYLLRRVATILARFGVGPEKFEAKLDRYVDVTREFGCVPTLPVTAVTLRRHPRPISRLASRDVELAVHGYIHADYESLPPATQRNHVRKAVDVFRSCHIPFVGFRAPYLRRNGVTLELLKDLELAYDSSHVVCWNVLDETRYGGKAWKEYSKLFGFYRSRDADQCLVLPRLAGGLTMIPVSIPDDEAMVDRLGIRDGHEIARIWKMILQRTHERGELFTVQLHPERIGFCEGALREVLQEARSLSPSVWIASLGEIAEWWKEREGFTLQVDAGGNGTWRVEADCSGRATILLRNCAASVPTVDWADGYRCVAARDFVLESPSRPFIGVGEGCSPGAIRFLEGEGFVVEAGGQPEDYGIYFDTLADFGESDEKRLCEAIGASDSPLIRYWRWPDQAKSAMAITGDIDSITLFDFVMRVYEVWRQNGR